MGLMCLSGCCGGVVRVGCVRWRWVLLVPAVVRLAVRAPRGRAGRWDRFWAQVRSTGDDGDVLWDPAGGDELALYCDLLEVHGDPALPVVDLGCGNGRFSRAFAAIGRSVVGVDLAPHAVALARVQSATTPAVSHAVLDVLDQGAVDALHGRLGDVDVFIRGVLHVMSRQDRRRLATAVGVLTGARGVVVLAETNYPGPLLGYLESLGARPSGLPGPLGRAISAGLPRPSPFGVGELADCFRCARWERVFTDLGARIDTVPAGPGQPRGTVAAHVAVLRRRR
jgi:SAM-dependent methyltransferase